MLDELVDCSVRDSGHAVPLWHSIFETLFLSSWLRWMLPTKAVVMRIRPSRTRVRSRCERLGSLVLHGSDEHGGQRRCDARAKQFLGCTRWNRERPGLAEPLEVQRGSVEARSGGFLGTHRPIGSVCEF